VLIGAETIDLPALTFDAALCRWGLMFLPDLKAGLSNVYRSLVDGGYFAVAVLASSDKVPLLALAIETLRKEVHAPATALGTPGPFSLGYEQIPCNLL
jgi:ubiquinone/menaquinone biosynthesis C-methylase UbiE